MCVCVCVKGCRARARTRCESSAALPLLLYCKLPNLGAREIKDRSRSQIDNCVARS